jgi:hypothetical protein
MILKGVAIGMRFETLILRGSSAGHKPLQAGSELFRNFGGIVRLVIGDLEA